PQHPPRPRAPLSPAVPHPRGRGCGGAPAAPPPLPLGGTGSWGAMMPAAPARRALVKAASKSSGLWTGTYDRLSPSVVAAVSSSRRREPGAKFNGLAMTAIRDADGNTSLNSSTYFCRSPGTRLVRPVTFPPGRARLLTSPAPTGSGAIVITIGIVDVA